MSTSPYFTIFSGIYNSAEVIHRLFTSIEHQTFRDFEWLIFDDASGDATTKIVENFIESHPDLLVSFIKRETNKGLSFNRWEALQMAKGKYFISWDHDDIQLENQLQTFFDIWEKYDSEDIGAICSVVKNENNEIVGVPFPAEVTISTYFYFYSKYIISVEGKLNERHLCNKTAKFIEAIQFIQNEGIITPPEFPNGSEVWGMMAYLGNKTIYINKVVRQYFIEPDRPSMTSTGTRQTKSKRIYRDRRVWINYFVDLLPPADFKNKMRTYVSFCLYANYSGYGLGRMLKDVPSFGKKLLIILMYIPSIFLKRLLG
jgi:glycosyltransferase involved in cell wall biosynthesis